MAKVKAKPIIYRDPSMIPHAAKSPVDESIRKAYEALLREPVPEELVNLAKSLKRQS